MADVIDLTSETPSELTENIPSMESLESTLSHIYNFTGTSENSNSNSNSSDEGKRKVGRPKGSGTSYTINLNQKRGSNLGKKYVLKPKIPKERKIRTPEQIEATHVKRLKSGLNHYYRVRAIIAETQRLVDERNSQISKILYDLKIRLELESNETLTRLEFNPINII